MADYILIRKGRNAVSSFLHVFLNLLLAVVAIGATLITGNVIIGLVLVVTSKWRIFAVNHRYWLLNLRSSLVDFIVGVSFILLAFAAGTTLLPVHFVLMAGYAVWLTFIKPRSSHAFTVVQALVAIVLGVTAAAIFAAITNAAVLVCACFLIGYATTYHVLVQTDDKDISFISMVAGLFFAETGWLSYAWLIFYTLGRTGIVFAQPAIILATLAFTFFEVHSAANSRRGKLKFADIALPVLFCLLVIIVLIVGFSQPRFNIH